MNIKAPIDPVIYVIALLFVIIVFIVYMEHRDGIIKDKWITACEAIGGEPFLDEYHRGIANSICLKPNSIIKVSVHE